MMASLHAHGHGSFFTMLVGNNGNDEVQKRLLNAKFHFELDSIYIEEEVFLDSGEMVETIMQLKLKNDEDVVYYLRSGAYRVFGLITSQIAASIVFLTLESTTFIVQVLNLL